MKVSFCCERFGANTTSALARFMTVALVLSCLSWSCADGTVPDQVNSVEDGAEDLTGDGVEDLAGDEGTDGAGDGSLTTDTDEQDGDELDGAVDGGTDGSNDESHTTDQPDESAAEDTTDEGETEDAAVDEDGHAADTVDTDGPDSDGDATVSCVNDDGCTIGEQWCVGGECVPCENSGTRCAIECDHGWETYSRNGCTPCECAPTNACVSDETCETEGDQCYAGEFCWDWCPPGDPSCCFGNICSAPGCSGSPSGLTCRTRGCAQGQSCATDLDSCASTGCSCNGLNWLCRADCEKTSCR